MKPPSLPRILGALLGLAFAVPHVCATVNHRPTLSGLKDQRIESGQFANETFTIFDTETSAASLIANAATTIASSNTTFINPTKAANLSLAGSVCTLGFPTVTGDGYAVITVTISDGTKSTSRAFVVERAAKLGTAPTESRIIQ